jgi:hypothetical protein
MPKVITKKVYVTQIPNRKDHATGAHVPTVNIAPASEHGDVIIMLPPTANFFATSDLIKTLREHLQYYDYEAGDSLLALGDPIIMTAAGALLGKMYGNFILLKWDKKIMRYVPGHVKV